MLGSRAVFTLASLGLAQALTISTNSSSPVTKTVFLSLVTPASSATNSSTTFTNAGEACNAQQISYSEASVAYSSSHPILATATNTANYTSVIFSSNHYECTRTCGSVCYAGPTSLEIRNTTVFSTDIVPYTTGAEYPSPSPNCTIGTSDCLNLLTSYSSASSSWISLSDAQQTITASPVRPSCSACIATGCTFAHGGMSLYYWPVTANVSRDYCAETPAGGQASTGLPNPNSTYVETTTGPYAVVDGITMYSGNIYLSMMEPFVTDNCGNTITRQSSGHNVITMASSDLYSVRGYPHNVIPWSVNWDDFNEPTPWSAYVGGWYCANNRAACSVVFPHDYHPVMSMPGQIRQLDPNWASCSFDQFGIFDPPTALHSVGNIFTSSSAGSGSGTTTTDPDPAVTATPDPGQSASDGSPSATAPAVTSTAAADPGQSTDPSDPGSSANSDPNDPTTSASAGGDPQSSAGGGSGSQTSVGGGSDPATSTAGSSPQDPQDPSSNQDPASTANGAVPGSNVASNPNAGPTGTGGGSPGTTASATGGSPGGVSSPVITVGPTVVPVDPTSGVVINPGTTLTSGGNPVTISDTTLSIGTGGLTIVSPSTSSVVSFGSSPVTISAGPNGSPVTVDPAGSVIIGGTTLSPGGSAVTVGGSTLSFGSSGIVVVDPSGTTSTIAVTPSSPQSITIGSSTFSIASGSVVLAPGTTLGPGDPAVTIEGTTYSVASTGVVVQSSGGATTVPITGAASSPQSITVGSSTFSVTSGSVVIAPGTTLGPGDPAVTVDGTTYSVASTGVVVQSSGGATTVQITGTGSGSGASGTSAGSSPSAYTGAAGMVEWDKTWMAVVVVEVVVGLIV